MCIGYLHNAEQDFSDECETVSTKLVVKIWKVALTLSSILTEICLAFRVTGKTNLSGAKGPSGPYEKTLVRVSATINRHGCVIFIYAIIQSSSAMPNYEIS